MSAGLSTVVRAVIHGLAPGPWAVVYQAVLGAVAAYVILRRCADHRAPERDLRVTAGMFGGGGAVVFMVAGLIGSPVGIVVAGCIMWVGVGRLLEQRVLVHPGLSQRVTAMICVVMWLVWLIAGAAIDIVRSL